MTDRIYLIVDPRGIASNSFYPTAQAAREACVAKNAILCEKWGVAGVYWRIKTLTPASSARVHGAENV